jgi:hypothetical protein
MNLAQSSPDEKGNSVQMNPSHRRQAGRQLDFITAGSANRLKAVSANGFPRMTVSADDAPILHRLPGASFRPSDGRRPDFARHESLSLVSSAGPQMAVANFRPLSRFPSRFYHRNHERYANFAVTRLNFVLLLIMTRGQWPTAKQAFE